MRSLLLLIIFTVAGLQLYSQTAAKLEGEYSGAKEGDKVYLCKLTDKKTGSFILLDSALLDNNCKFTFRLDGIEPDRYQIRVKPYKLDLFIDGSSDIYIKAEKEFSKSRIISNSSDSLVRKFENTNMNLAFSQVLLALTNKQYKDKGLELPDSVLQSSIKRITELNTLKSDICKEALAKSGYPLAYIALNGGLDEFSGKELSSAYERMDGKIKNSSIVTEFKKLVDKTVNLSEGGRVPDFKSKTPEGKEVCLYDFIKGKKVVLIDFWASWCSPCRRENKNVVAVYNEYKDKGFDIISISLDSKLENWKEAIINDNLEWTHVSDLGGWADKTAKLYNVSAVPSSFLVDEKGVVIAKNLRGEELGRMVMTICNK